MDLGAELDIIRKSGSWFSIGDERIGQGRDNARQYLIDHPDVADQVEAGIRANFDKLQGIAKKKTPAAAQPAAKGVDVSAEDFDEA